VMLGTVDPRRHVDVNHPQLTADHDFATLSRELGEFLIELSIGVHRYAMYPLSHPSLVPVVDRILGRLAAIFVERPKLSIGVAQRRLVIGGSATDPHHPVLSDLARRLHDHRIAAVDFVEGAGAGEIEELLRTLAAETERGAEPVGLRPADEVPRWDCIRLHPVGYDSLMLASGDEPFDSGRADGLWLDLAQAVLSEEAPDKGADPARMARAIRERDDAQYAQVIARYLRDVAHELRTGSTREAEKIRKRVAELIDELDETSLGRLLHAGGSPEWRREFLVDAAHSLSVAAVLRLLRSAAQAPEQEVSHSLVRMLSKLATYTEGGGEAPAGRADTALRENMEELIRDWHLDDPNPERYTDLLDGIARTSPALQPSQEQEEDPLSAAHRILDMALEIDAYGPTVEWSISRLLDQGEGALVLDRLGSSGEGHRASSRIQEFLSTPDRLHQLLSGEDVHEPSLRRLVIKMGDSAIDPLLDVLSASDSRAVRRKVFDVVAILGEPVSSRAVARLEDDRWYVVRNMLALLQRVGAIPPGFDPVQYTWYSDRRVRREALALAMHDSRLREWAVAEALSDADERLVRMALVEVRERVPETVVPMIVKRVVRAERPSELRALAAVALGGSSSPLAREALIEMASEGRSLFGRVTASPEVIQALGVLAATWPDHPDAAGVLAWAKKSKDPALRNAVETGPGGTE